MSALSRPLPVGHGERRIDRPITIAPAAAAETLPRKDRERIRLAVRMLERIRARAMRKPTNAIIREYAALHWALEIAGIVVRGAR